MKQAWELISLHKNLASLLHKQAWRYFYEINIMCSVAKAGLTLFMKLNN